MVSAAASGLDLTCRLGVNYDVDRLIGEYQAIARKFSFAMHHRPDHHDGGWTAIGLVASRGDPLEDRSRGRYRKTELVKYAPYMESIIDSFATRVLRVRLMSLAPGARIHWHFDAKETLDYGAVRLHIPVISNPDVEFQICHQRCRWRAGELWYGDFSFPHRLHNRGEQARIHLVLDLGFNRKLEALFPREFLAQRKRREQLRRLTQDQYSTRPPSYRRNLFARTKHGALIAVRRWVYRYCYGSSE